MRKITLLFLFLLFSVFLHAQTLVVDTVMTIANSFFDTIIVKSNGRLTITIKGNITWQNMIIVDGLVMVEPGGKITGDRDRGFLAVKTCSIINNSGTDSIENISLNLIGDGTRIGGLYPSRFVNVWAGWYERHITLDTTVIITGRIFENFSNSFILNGHDLILDTAAYVYKFNELFNVFMMDSISRLIKKVRPKQKYIIPLSESMGDMPQRTELIIDFTDSTVMDADPAVIIKLRANEPAPGAVINPAITTDYLKRYVDLEFVNIPNPDVNISLQLAQWGADTMGDINKMLNVLWNGTEWKYGKPLNWSDLSTDPSANNQLFMEWEHVTDQHVILTAGRNIGAIDSVCNTPVKISLSGITDSSAIVFWKSINDVSSGYKVFYRNIDSAEWNILFTAAMADTLNNLTPSGEYEVMISALCNSSSDTSVCSSSFRFSNAVPGYYFRNNKNVIYLTGNQSIPDYIRFDTVVIRKNSTVTLNRHLFVNTLVIVDTNATLNLDNFALYGNCDLYVRPYATLRYSHSYIKGNPVKYFNCLRNRRQFINSLSNIILNGRLNGNDGQIIDDNFPSRVFNLTLAATGRISYKRNPVEVTGSFINYSQNIEGIDGKILVRGTSIQNYNPSVFINGDVEISGKNIVCSGTFPFRFNKLFLKKYTDTVLLTFNNDIEVTGDFGLDNSFLVLNGHSLTVPGIKSTGSQIIAETGGSVVYNLHDYSTFLIPFGKGRNKEFLPVCFTPVRAILTDSSRIIFTFRDDTVPGMGAAPVNFISRYLYTNTSAVTDLKYNVAFNYSDADINGKENLLEQQILSAGTWYNSFLSIDSVNNKVKWNGLERTGYITAGNFLGFNSAAPQCLSVRDITTNTAVVSWCFPSNEVVQWSVNYKSLTDSVWSSFGSATKEAELDSLTPATQYMVFISTNEKASYDTIVNSDTLVFTMLSGSCNQPVGFGWSSAHTSSALIKWDGGVPPFRVEMCRDDLGWSSKQEFTLSDTFLLLSGLQQEYAYRLKVFSVCNAVSDSIMVFPFVSGYDSSLQELRINTDRIIPFNRNFRKIVIEKGGIGRMMQNLTFIDTLLINKGGRLVCDTFILNGFVFVNSDSSFIESKHTAGFMLSAYDGNIQTIVRNFNVMARYVFNGESPQQMDDFLTAYNFITIDNPTTVKAPPKNLNIGGQLLINKGVFLFDPYNVRLTINKSAKLINHSGPGALNYHKCFLKMNGGDNGSANMAVLDGSEQTYVDSFAIDGYDVVILKSPLRINNKLNMIISDGKVGLNLGIKVDSASLILDPGCSIVNYGTTRIITTRGGRVVLNYDAALLDKKIFIPMGDNSYSNYCPVDFTLHSGSIINPGSFVSISMVSGSAHPYNDTATPYLKRYYSVLGNNIGTPLYSVALGYLSADIVGSKSLCYNARWDSVWYYYSKLDSLNNKMIFDSITCWGDLTGREIIFPQSVNSLLTENGLFSVYPNPSGGTINVLVPQIIPGFCGEIFNADGKLIKSFGIESHNTTVNLTALPNGIYLIHCFSANSYQASKVLLIKK